MKWTEMTSEQKNALIHEKVMDGQQAQCPNKYPRITFNGYQILEWRCSRCGQTGRGGAVHDKTTGGYAVEHTTPNVPSYITSMDAAWLVVKRVNRSDNPDYPDYGTYARFIDALQKTVGSDLFFDLFYCDDEGDHLTPERICLAALKACGIEIE